ncbi:DUF934 domain-containing protein [Parvibium lacunae]|uniref:DUF934 domain-containing protein n=1 Tax=Parvibium lacunae TaxID=1888893 RepID=A0A368KZM3_9BURK|nr:DUF934 domain-containing protein [Parvibium lacunae]RCS56471.1 DUF934 domain-containing protein [Parvibium lacunae]
MAKIILGNAVVDDTWTLVREDSTALPTLPVGDVIVSLARYQAEKAALLARGTKIGVWLQPTDEPEILVSEFANLALIAVDFPAFKDGRGYSIGWLLRGRYGWQGELRAIGDVLQDQLFFYKRVGFNAYAVREDKDIHEALNGLQDFSEVYAGSIDQPIPLFRRRAA